MASDASPTPHPLKAKWFLFYQRTGGSSGETTAVEGDYITTVEEVFASMRALPNVTLFPQNEGIAFARDKIEPKFESFPDGYRITIFTRSKAQLDTVMPLVFGAAMGEAICKQFAGEEEPIPEAGVIRITHKPHRIYMESSSIDIWFPANPHQEAVDKYFKELTKPVAGVQISCRPLG